jgi:hypothetical protein
MNIILSSAQLAGLAFATTKRNTANPSADPMTPEQFAADLLGVQCDRFAAEQASALIDLMRPVGAEIAAAAGGDIAKITAALNAGKTAALKTLS